MVQQQSLHPESLQTQAIRRRTDELSNEEVSRIGMVEDIGCDFHNFVVGLEDKFGPNRNFSLAKTKIEEAIMWATKGVTHAARKVN